jgi:hypothetical protein
VQRIGCPSLHIHPTHPISYRRISISSNMSRTACRESSFNHGTNCSQEWGRDWVRSQSRLCSAFSSPGWRDSNGLLRRMVIIIHKLNVRWFGFPHLSLGIEVLNLSGTGSRTRFHTTAFNIGNMIHGQSRTEYYWTEWRKTWNLPTSIFTNSRMTNINEGSSRHWFLE